MPAALRLVKLAERGSLEALLDWAFSDQPASKAFEIARESLPGLTSEEEAELLLRVEELSRTVAALTGLNLVGEVMDDLKEQEADGVAVADFAPPDIESMYEGEEPSELDVIASSNTQMSFAFGKQQEDEQTDDWWEYEAQSGACDICAPLDGTQAPQDDGIWADRIPPIHPFCVCRLKTIPAQKVRATEDDVPDESRGRRGWGDPRKRFDPDLSDKPAALLPLYEDKLRNLRSDE